MAYQHIEQALTKFVSRAGEKLRRQGLMANQVSVFIMTSRFDDRQPYYDKSISCNLPYPTDYTPEILHYATALLKRIYIPGKEYKKCGVMLLNLVESNRNKSDLFESRDMARMHQLMIALDSINSRYGAGSAYFGDIGILSNKKPLWAMRDDRKSQRYTTHWDELVETTL